jgi:hypothetical protein
MTSKYEKENISATTGRIFLKFENQSVQRYKMKITSNRRQPPMEDDLNILKVEYISNHWSDLAQI